MRHHPGIVCILHALFTKQHKALIDMAPPARTARPEVLVCPHPHVRTVNCSLPVKIAGGAIGGIRYSRDYEACRVTGSPGSLHSTHSGRDG